MAFAGLLMSPFGLSQDQEEPATSDLEEIEEGIPIEEEEDEMSQWQSVPEGQETLGGLSIQQIVEPPVEYHYSAFGKPDPFKSPTKEEIAEARKAENEALGSGVSAASAEIPIISPLQQYPLDVLAVKGIWLLTDGRKKALIMTPKKEGFIVEVGDPISAGKVTEIFKTHVVVRQYRIRRDGSREFEDEELYLGNLKPSRQSFLRLRPGEAPLFDMEMVNKSLRSSAKEEAAKQLSDLREKSAGRRGKRDSRPAEKC